MCKTFDEGRVVPRHTEPKDMDPSSSSSPEEQEAYREGGRPCCIQPLHHFFNEPWRKHSRLSICCGHAVPRHKLERQCSSSLERVEWTRLSSRIWTHRVLHQKSKRPTVMVDGLATFNLSWQRSPRTEAGPLPLRPGSGASGRSIFFFCGPSLALTDAGCRSGFFPEQGLSRNQS